MGDNDRDTLDPSPISFAQHENEETMENEDATEKEPSYAKANSLSFFQLCRRMEHLSELRRGRRTKRPPPNDAEKLNTLLQSRELQEFATTTEEPHSLFPVLRLLMPHIDSSRSLFMKEASIGQAYMKALGLSRTSRHDQALANYKVQRKVHQTFCKHDDAFELSCACGDIRLFSN